MTEARSLLLPGDPAPMFLAPSNINPDFDFATGAGRYIVLTFLGPSDGADTKTRFEAFLTEAALFANPDFYLFGVALGDAASADAVLKERRSGMDTFWDDGKLSRTYGALPAGNGSGGFEPVSYLLGIDLRILGLVRHPYPKQHGDGAEPPETLAADRVPAARRAAGASSLPPQRIRAGALPPSD